MDDNAWRESRDRFHRQMERFGATPLLGVKSPDGSVLLSHAAFEAYEGPYEVEPYLRLHLCTVRVGRICRNGSDGTRLEGVMRPGSVGITLPDVGAEGYWPRAEVLAIMIRKSHLAKVSDGEVSLEQLEGAASTLHRDPLVSTVMSAMWRDAEAHGLSSAFFEHGLAVALKRLAEYRHVPRRPKRESRPLARRSLQRIMELIESRIGDDVRVSELATECDLDVRSFTRAFRAATGFAPYEYLTERRMERAMSLLAAGAAVTEVAFQVGYSNPSKFSAAFRRFNGCTPTRWRRDQP